MRVLSADPRATPPVMAPCTIQEWVAQNKNNYNFYYENYPLRESGIELPVTMERLKYFYVMDMNERNLVPLNEYLTCYSYLFEYLIGRVSGMITNKGSNWFERLFKAVPAAFQKTWQDITAPFGIPLFAWLAIGAATIIILKD